MPPIRRPRRWPRKLRAAASRHATFIVPVFVLMLGLSGSLWLWHTSRSTWNRDIKDDTELAAHGLTKRLQMLVQDEVRPLRRLARELADGSIATPRAFAKAANSVQKSVTSLSIIVWVDAEGRILAVSPAQRSGLSRGDVLPEDSAWAEALRKQRRRDELALISGNDGKRPMQWGVLGIPVRENRRDNSGAAVLAKLDLGGELGPASDEIAGNWFDVDIRDAGDQVVYTSGRWRGSHPLNVRVPMRTMNETWHVHVHPTDAFTATRMGSRANLLLGGGVILSIIASAGAAQALVNRRRERVRAAAHIEALQALSNISAGMAERPGESRELLTQLTEVAARLMNMPMRVLLRYDPARQVLCTDYRAGVRGPGLKPEYALQEAAVSGSAMASGTIRMIGDVTKEAPESLPLLNTYGVRSLVALPLSVGGNPMGVIVLAGRTPRRFSDVDRQLAELWHVEARAILSNRWLYEQMDNAVKSLQRLLQQHETVYHVNTIIQNASSLRDVLEQIAELAPSALEVDACVVCLQAQSSSGQLEIAALNSGARTDGSRAGEPVRTSAQRVVECTMCASAMHSGQIRFIEDTSEFAVRGFPEMGSGMFVPLKPSATAKSNGVLVLLRAKPGPFDPEQIRLAELFGSRAGAAIESARLLDETRRQAETNAVLLRELNHRVGNNLASIVGLLSMGAGQLPEQAQQWLHRTTERVAMMARAHEMFAGGARSVGLKELATTTLASVSAIRGADVTFSLELDAVDVKLPSSRAITLAMVLHELAYNAVVHALGGGGHLTVRGRRLLPNRIVIEVMDQPADPLRRSLPRFGRAANVPVAAHVGAASSEDGNGHPSEPGGGATAVLAPPSTVRTSGTGLQLVRNLVTRELRGSFSLSREESDRADVSGSGGGGTTAVIEMPVDFPSESGDGLS